MAALWHWPSLGSVSRLTGIAHLRGHETDRLAALSAEINGLGGDCAEEPDALVITARPLHGESGILRRPSDGDGRGHHRPPGARRAGRGHRDHRQDAAGFPGAVGGDARLSSRHDYDESDVRIRSGRGSRPAPRPDPNTPTPSRPWW